MPTYQPLPRFWRDYKRLPADQKADFQEAVKTFKEGLETGIFDPGLDVHRIHGTPGVWALSWGDDNDHRATFQYGKSVHSGEPHIIWRRVGTHSIYRKP